MLVSWIVTFIRQDLDHTVVDVYMFLVKQYKRH